MKKNISILYKSAVGLASLIIFAVACSDDLTMGENLRQNILFSFDFAEKANADAKTTTDIWLKTTFDKDDAIGIFAYKRHTSEESSIKSNELYANNVKALFDGQTWTLDIPIYYTNDDSVLDVYAYYPYIQNANATALQYNAVKNMEDMLAATFLGIDKATGQPVPLMFSHMLTMVQLTIVKGPTFPDMDNTFNAYFHGAIGGVYNLATKMLTNSFSGVVTMTLVSKSDAIARVYRVWVPEQQIAKSDVLFSFSQTTSEREVSLAGEAPNEITLVSGNVEKLQMILQNHVPKDYLYKMYDPYPKYGTPVGIVVNTYNGGKNGRVISLKDGLAKWAALSGKTESTDHYDGISNTMKIQALPDWKTLFPAFASCAELGEGWYLPALEDAYYHLKDDVSNVNYYLRNIVGSDPIEGTYWTSTESSADKAYKLYIRTGNTDPVAKTTELKIRALYQF